MLVSFVIAVALLFGALLSYIAQRRGTNHVFWAVMGICFGPLALPFVFFTKKQEASKNDSRACSRPKYSRVL